MLAVAPDQSAADQLAEALLGAGLVDDVIALSRGRWLGSAAAASRASSRGR
jgi:hypothetical protein